MQAACRWMTAHTARQQGIALARPEEGVWIMAICDTQLKWQCHRFGQLDIAANAVLRCSHDCLVQSKHSRTVISAGLGAASSASLADCFIN